MEVTGQKVRKRGYSGARLELIKKAASLSLEEYTIPEIARELRVSDSTVRRLLAASEGLPASYLTETAQVAPPGSPSVGWLIDCGFSGRTGSGWCNRPAI